MDKIKLSIDRQQKALKAMHAAKSTVFKHFWFNVFGKILSKSIIANHVEGLVEMIITMVLAHLN